MTAPYEHDPIGNDRRRNRRSRSLPDDAACSQCGITEPATLQLKRRLLEEHHVVGHDNDQHLIDIECRNCHAIATARQHDAGVANSNTEPPATVLHRLDQSLRSLASYFHLLAETFIHWSTALRDLIAQLDDLTPTWRTLNAAKATP